MWTYGSPGCLQEMPHIGKQPPRPEVLPMKIWEKSPFICPGKGKVITLKYTHGKDDHFETSSKCFLRTNANLERDKTLPKPDPI